MSYRTETIYRTREASYRAEECREATKCQECRGRGCHSCQGTGYAGGREP